MPCNTHRQVEQTESMRSLWLTILTGSLPTQILFLLSILSTYSSPFITYLGPFLLSQPQKKSIYPLIYSSERCGVCLWGTRGGGGGRSVMHLYSQVPSRVVFCGHVDSVSEGEENAHLRTVWYDSPGGVRGCAGEGRCICLQTWSSGGLPPGWGWRPS